ncbi:MAG: peroxiredoxin [Gammaproteobacteria bacterium]|nr:peroxiredoxin [Gammaproteobacteria bacterium]
MFSALHANTLEIGQVAPSFELIDQDGQTHSLEKYRGQWVVMYFYPKDDTPGCTKEACAFRDDYKTIRAQNTQILGISVDSSESHAEFTEKYNLPFPLLVDIDGHVAKHYQSLTSLGFIKLAKRHTFIIDPSGIIKMIYRKVKPSSHSDQVLSDLVQLQTN